MPDNRKCIEYADTIDQVIRVLSPEQLKEIKDQLIGKLFKQKLLLKFRFLGKYYFVAVDATGTHTFNHKHCEHCLTKTSKNGVTIWFHYVLEAKLVTSSGLVPHRWYLNSLKIYRDGISRSRTANKRPLLDWQLK